MPDKNKLQVFTDENVRIVRACSTCKHGNFPSPQASWGTCGKHVYAHAKHDPTPRPLPAHIAFVCSGYEEDGNLAARRELGAYANLVGR